MSGRRTAKHKLQAKLNAMIDGVEKGLLRKDFEKPHAYEKKQYAEEAFARTKEFQSGRGNPRAPASMRGAVGDAPERDPAHQKNVAGFGTSPKVLNPAGKPSSNPADMAPPKPAAPPTPMVAKPSMAEPKMPKLPPTSPGKPTMVATKSVSVDKADPLEEQHQKLTQKLQLRAQGGGKRAARRAQLAAFGKAAALNSEKPVNGEWSRDPADRKRDGLANRFKPVAKKEYGGPVTSTKNRERPSGIRVAGKPVSKSFQVMSIDDYHTSMMKAEKAPAAPGTGAPKRFPRAAPSATGKPRESASGHPLTAHQYANDFSDEEPTKTKMKPISDQEAMANLASGKFKREGSVREKSLVMLAAIKALTTGYSRTTGGGVLRAANRGNLTLADLSRAMSVMPKPAKTPPSVYLPGVSDPKSPLRQKKGKKPLLANKACTCDESSEEPTLKKRKNVVHKSEGAATMAKTNFNDLFKAELGIAADDVLVDCPHCEAPITKSDIATANAKGRTMAGGKGHGQVKSNRGVPGAKKSDEVVGVQNGKGSKARKSDVESDDDDMDKGDFEEQELEQQAAPIAPPKQMQKGATFRGTEFVQYVDYGDAPGGDAYIAKSIAEAQGQLGQHATQPMDLNNDLSRLLV